MISSFEVSKPTEAQQIQDQDFLDTVKRDLCPGLLEELCERHEGFADMDGTERVFCLVNDDGPNHGKGDCLPIEYNRLRFYAYSGVELDDSPTTYYSLEAGLRFGYMKPLFDERVSENTYTSRISLFEHSVRKSDLRMYLYSERGRYPGSEEIRWDHIPKYSEMPVAYRVALVCLYVSRHVVALPSDVTAFVLGATESLETQRFIYQPTQDRDGFDNGWVLRIRDVRPSQSFMLQIASYLCGVVAEEERRQSEFAKKMREKDPHADEHYNLASQFEPKSKRKARAANEETETIIAYIDSRKARGETIGRGGTSWDDVAGQLAADTGIVREGKNLRDSYKSYKKRHGGGQ